MKSFPRAVAGAIGIGILYQVLVFNFPNTVGLVQFVRPDRRAVPGGAG